jgi:hypothetical protein
MGNQWSALYLDYITHYGDIDSFRRASVCVIVPNSIYELSKWYKGCGFNPELCCFASLEEVKKAGEAWVDNGK